MRAFIFSLDAFVAFTLALVAIYSLIFFSNVPSSYYYLLTQGHYLTRDVLMALSTTTCVYDDYGGGCTNYEATVLENIVSQDNPAIQDNLIENTVGEMVPEQFGYIVEMSDDQGQNWHLLYDRNPSGSSKAKKLSVSSQVIAFDYSGEPKKLPVSPYNYLTCGPLAYADEEEAQESGFVDFGLITCGVIEIADDESAMGNTHPSNVLYGDLVPSSDVAIVRLTVYI
ncbi:hypothetical protein KKB44_06420 [Candidatus Micrarchaeota archaeon]|nr:hypothetical protein [Candidatus Micrarchaeota archaeon]